MNGCANGVEYRNLREKKTNGFIFLKFILVSRVYLNFFAILCKPRTSRNETFYIF